MPILRIGGFPIYNVMKDIQWYAGVHGDKKVFSIKYKEQLVVLFDKAEKIDGI